MVTITRSLARQLRATFRRLFNMRGTGPAVTFIAGLEKLSVRVKSADAAIEYHAAGELPPDILAVPFELLTDCEGRKDEPVKLDRVSANRITAEWQDGGVPQIVRYNAMKVVEDFPEPPQSFIENPSSLLDALKEASETADPDASRFALGHILLKGPAGSLAATDGRQLFMQSGFQFPWDDQVLVPRSKIFGSPELPHDQPIEVGRSGDWIVLRVHPWTIWLAVNKDGRFPEVERHIPQPATATARLTIDPADAAFLESALPKLPTDETNNWPVTVDLNGSLAIRGRSKQQERPTELVLSRSQRSGDPIRLNTNRKFLARALKLGFRELLIYGAASPVLCQDEHRQYVWAVLEAESAIKPVEDAIQIDSMSVGPVTVSSARQPKKERKTMPVNRIQDRLPTPPATEASPSAAKQPSSLSKRIGNGDPLADLIEQAETLRQTLRETLTKTNELYKTLKRHRRQTRAVQSTLASLRQLQAIGV